MQRVMRIPILLSIMLAGLALAGCATPGGYGDRYGGDPYGGTYGDPYGSGGGYGNPNDPYYGGGYGNQYGSQRVMATVESVDPRYGRMLLVTQDPRGYSGSRIEVFFDTNTRLYYQGRAYPVTGLERGDQISVDAVQSNGRLWARQIEVVRNVRDSGYRY